MTVLQWVIYTNHPTPIAFVGMVIVTSAGLFSAVRRFAPRRFNVDASDSRGHVRDQGQGERG